MLRWIKLLVFVLWIDCGVSLYGVGISSNTATNISAYQAYLSTNSLNSNLMDFVFQQINSLSNSLVDRFSITNPIPTPIPPSGVFTNGTISYVATNGNDASFVRGNAAFPAKTIAWAVSNMLAGDSLFITAGYYNNSNRWLLPTNSMIFGSGKDSTIVFNWFNGGDTMMIPSDNSWIRDFAVIGNGGNGFAPMWGCMDEGAFTNALIQRMAFSNHIDCLFVEQSSKNSSANVDSCVFQTKWDAVVWRVSDNPAIKTLNIFNSNTYKNAGNVDWGGYDIQGSGSEINAYDCFFLTTASNRMFYLFDGGKMSISRSHFSYPIQATTFIHLDNRGSPCTLNLINCDPIPSNLINAIPGSINISF